MIEGEANLQACRNCGAPESDHGAGCCPSPDGAPAHWQQERFTPDTDRLSSFGVLACHACGEESVPAMLAADGQCGSCRTIREIDRRAGAHEQRPIERSREFLTKHAAAIDELSTPDGPDQTVDPQGHAIWLAQQPMPTFSQVALNEREVKPTAARHLPCSDKSPCWDLDCTDCVPAEGDALPEQSSHVLLKCIEDITDHARSMEVVVDAVRAHRDMEKRDAVSLHEADKKLYSALKNLENGSEQ